MGNGDARDLGHPAAIAEVKEARDVRLPTLLHTAARVALALLDRALRLCRGVHVLGAYRARQTRPQPARLVGLLLVLGRDPLRCYVLPVLLRVEEHPAVALYVRGIASTARNMMTDDRGIVSGIS